MAMKVLGVTPPLPKPQIELCHTRGRALPKARSNPGSILDTANTPHTGLLLSLQRSRITLLCLFEKKRGRGTQQSPGGVC